MLLPSVARRVLRRVYGARLAPAILMYHRVAELQHDPWGLAVSRATFGQQLAYLKHHHTPMPLDQLVEGLRSKKLPHNTVAITFDDGYRDNLVNAKPLLLRHGLPATLFLATGWVGSSVPFWWDELAEFTLCSSQTVDHTEVIDGESLLLRWGEPERADMDGAWRASCEPQTARQKTYLTLWRKLRGTSQTERTRAMTSLRAFFPAEHNSLSMPMNSAEVQELTHDGVFTIGAHTVHHPALTSLSAAECRDEILASAKQCLTLTGAEVSAFAYPYGDVNEMVRNVVAGAEFLSACTTRAAHLDVDLQDMYALPRLAIPNCDIAQFAGMLSC